MSQTSFQFRRRRGFTLVELLVVIGGVALLVCPSIRSVQPGATDTDGCEGRATQLQDPGFIAYTGSWIHGCTQQPLGGGSYAEGMPRQGFPSTHPDIYPKTLVALRAADAHAS